MLPFMNQEKGRRPGLQARAVEDRHKPVGSERPGAGTQALR